jgi:hypothetical protein
MMHDGQRATLSSFNAKDGTHEKSDERPLGVTRPCGQKVPIKIQRSIREGNVPQIGGAGSPIERGA